MRDTDWLLEKADPGLGVGARPARRTRFLQRQGMRSRCGRQVGDSSLMSFHLISPCHLLHQLDQTTAQLRIFDTHERLDQRETVGGRQKIGDVGG